MKTILFIYGSVGGNTQMAVEAVAGFLGGAKWGIRIQKAELSRPEDLAGAEVVVLAAPTYGHGSLESTMGEFVAKLKSDSLRGKPCAVIGLGDPRYEVQYHLESAAILEKVVADAGGKLLIPSLRISRTPVMHLRGFIPNWAGQLAKALETV